ncbi:MAG: nickel pincer cofactor biosynthesis protein LarB [Fibrobacter sp.]|nr:nickel pincer cofactor biosynthesis protein LarB [Fibrobacter sp.]
MDNQFLEKLLSDLYKNDISVNEAFSQLKDLPFKDLGFAKIDHHRALRKGYPEVIFCQSKSPEQVVAIVKNQIDHNETVFGTRANETVINAVKENFPNMEIDSDARCFWLKSEAWRPRESKGNIYICTGGTADYVVALECKRTIEILGHKAILLSDIGVSGIHRLLSYREELNKASVIIAIAGMEGALASVIAGFVSCPVIGVPTSVGYGSHLNGLVSLFAMLNSCASGLTVVNIDNGFGAACAAVSINEIRDNQRV